MNRVEIRFEGRAEAPWAAAARDFALAALEEAGLGDWDLSLLFCGDEEIRVLNRDFRDKDEATDVLSFEQGGSYLDAEGRERTVAGDIVVSLDRLAANARDFGVGEDEELRRLILHGILHLSGLDHEDNDPARPMLRKQESLLAALAERGGAGRAIL